MPTLPQLCDVQTYRPCDWDLAADADGLRYWLGLFREQFEQVTAPLIRAEYQFTDEQAAEVVSAFLAELETLAHRPRDFERLDILAICAVRQHVLERFGAHDPFHSLKQRENEQALRLLPEVLNAAAQEPEAARPALLVQNLMAGNIFDLGAMETALAYHRAELTFADMQAKTPKRPWLIDDLHAWSQRVVTGEPYRHVLVFVDNAGSDLVLGWLPMTRWFLSRGARVTLAANSQPALNDVTAEALSTFLARVSETDHLLAAAVADQRLLVVESGGWLPLLDLTTLSDACVDAADDADLIVLHGMGRALESNWTANLRGEALRIACIKDPAVASRLGGEMYDCVFRWTRA